MCQQGKFQACEHDTGRSASTHHQAWSPYTYLVKGSQQAGCLLRTGHCEAARHSFPEAALHIPAPAARSPAAHSPAAARTRGDCRTPAAGHTPADDEGRAAWPRLRDPAIGNIFSNSRNTLSSKFVLAGTGACSSLARLTKSLACMCWSLKAAFQGTRFVRRAAASIRTDAAMMAYRVRVGGSWQYLSAPAVAHADEEACCQGAQSNDDYDDYHGSRNGALHIRELITMRPMQEETTAPKLQSPRSSLRPFFRNTKFLSVLIRQLCKQRHK